MEDLDKLIMGDDRTPQLSSPFGNYIHKPYFIRDGQKIEKRDLKKEEEETKNRENEVENLFSSFKLQNCSQKLAEPQPRLSTGCRYINEFLHGGIATQRLVEIFGEAGTGKTQFAIQLLLNSVLPPKLGGLGGKAL
jgi:RecA/RadA recombinase